MCSKRCFNQIHLQVFVFLAFICNSLGDSHLQFLLDDGNTTSEEPEESSIATTLTTFNTSISTTTVTDSIRPSSWMTINTPKLVLVIILSFAIPAIFMTLLLWRLQKEKKYLNPRNGALVYRETILVPSYAAENSNATHINPVNIAPMYTTLYDTPPEYEQAVEMPVTVTVSTLKSKTVEASDAPPPAYSAHF